MARLLISSALAGLLLSGAALAQPDDHHDRGPGGAAPAGHPAPAAHPAAAPRAAPASHDARPGNAPSAPDHRQAVDRRPSAGQQAAPQAQPGPRAAMRGAPAGGGPARGPAMAMHGPATGNHNFASFQRNVTAQRRYHAPAYHQPQGWYAHRWTFGQTLPALFWAQDFWISDYTDFGLMPPPPGTVWVRDGGDALLIDQEDGEIIQVDYSVFY